MPGEFDTAFVEVDRSLLSTFGEPVFLDTIQNLEILAIVDLPVVGEKIGNIETEMQQPGFDAAESDIIGLEKTHICTVRQNKYRVTEVLPDGTGMARVNLVIDTPDPILSTGVFR